MSGATNPPTDPGPVAVEARITGRVQGVWFRGWTRREALDLGLRGWVRNAQDGSVLALFVGPRPAVDTMLERCRSGPLPARVESITVAPVTPVPDPADFRVSARPGPSARNPR